MFTVLADVLRNIHDARIKMARYNIEGSIIVIVSYDSYSQIKREVGEMWGFYSNVQDNQETRIMGAKLLTSDTLKGYDIKVVLELN
ncbi:hypothetical protein MKA87_004381 [Salmonella enterica]|nr:hypothetical protein [Salmonella enterica]